MRNFLKDRLASARAVHALIHQILNNGNTYRPNPVRSLRLSALVLQKGINLVMRPAKVEDERSLLALKDKPQIQAASALHERADPPQANSSVQVRLSTGRTGCLHCGQDFLSAGGRNAFQKARGGLQPHGTRSATSVISRNFPARRTRAASLLTAAPALTLWAGVSAYSDAK